MESIEKTPACERLAGYTANMKKLTTDIQNGDTDIEKLKIYILKEKVDILKEKVDIQKEKMDILKEAADILDERVYIYLKAQFGPVYWAQLGVTSGVFLTNMLHIFRFYQNFEGWEVLSTHDKWSFLRWAGHAVISAASIYFHANLLKFHYRFVDGISRTLRTVKNMAKHVP
ncbi:hypothetical protein FQN49_005286 [Arthroderma sp. PD_2]|nr:hypothetical protein FQN49_005286 [Arthroderma sp. PD_2]